MYISRLFIAQASSSFKRLDICMFMYATPTFITKALRLVTQVQLLLMTVTVNQRLIQCWFDMPTPTHTIPTIITKAFRLVACVQLFKRNVKVKVTVCTAIAYSY